MVLAMLCSIIAFGQDTVARETGGPLTESEQTIVLTPRSQAGTLLTVGGIAGLVASGILYTQALNQVDALVDGANTQRADIERLHRSYNRTRVAYTFVGLSSFAALGGGQVLILVDNFGRKESQRLTLEVHRTF